MNFYMNQLRRALKINLKISRSSTSIDHTSTIVPHGNSYFIAFRTLRQAKLHISFDYHQRELEIATKSGGGFTHFGGGFTQFGGGFTQFGGDFTQFGGGVNLEAVSRHSVAISRNLVVDLHLIQELPK